MVRNLNIGVVGCGKIAEVTHLPGFNSVQSARVVALCDSNAARMKALRDKAAPDAELFTDFNAFLKSGLDAVAICTPNNLHCTMTLAAFRSGLHVLCEKPLAGMVRDANRMVAAARQARRILHVNQSLRYHPHYVTLAKLVAKGSIGDPIHARCIRAGGSTPDKGWSPGATWFVSRRNQGGIILDIAVHMADVLKWIMGDVREIAATVDTQTPGINVPDTVTALFRFRSGSTAVLELSWALPVGSCLLEIYGTKGRIRMGFSKQPIELTRIGTRGPKTTYPNADVKVRDSFDCFVRAIRGKALSPTPGELGRDSVALCEAIAQAGRQHKFVRVKRFRS